MTNNEAFKALFDELKITQVKFAARHEIIPQTVHKWLKNKLNISNKTLEKIAKKEGYKVTFNIKIEKI